MELNFKACKSIMDTLPISFYLKREGITADLSEREKDSYYNPAADHIVVSYPSLCDMVSYIHSTKDLESEIRAILYHEISHAILTPADLKRGYNGRENDAINVFEDERIETILKDFYLGVDFKKSIIALNDYHGEPPRDAFSAFYDTVRFRAGKPEHLRRVDNIIQKYWNITNNNSQHSFDYVSDILLLLYDIAKDWLEEHDRDKLEDTAKKQQGREGKSGGSGGSDSSESTDSTGKGSSDSKGSSSPTYDGLSDYQKDEVVKSILEEQNDGRGNQVGVGKDGEPGKLIDMPMPGNWHIPSYDDEEEARKELERLAETSRNATTELDKTKIQRMLETSMNKFIDKKLTDDIAMIFENFLSRHKNNSAAIARYSGVINPRLIATRDDWRIWEYKSTDGPIKGYDKLHLNLFIDTSGSYGNNEDKTNTILRSLTTLEQKYSFFSFDLVTMQRTETLRSKDERYIRACGGNDLDDKIKDIYKQLQDPKSFNYNIVLFDGDAFTDTPRGQVEAHERNFGTFNNSKCSIISDSDNKKPIEKYAPLSHHILVDWHNAKKSYADMLFDNILESLTRALL